MDRRILEIVNSFTQWKGNPFTLAALLTEMQKQIDRESLIAANMPDAAEVIV